MFVGSIAVVERWVGEVGYGLAMLHIVRGKSREAAGLAGAAKNISFDKSDDA